MKATIHYIVLPLLSLVLLSACSKAGVPDASISDGQNNFFQELPPQQLIQEPAVGIETTPIVGDPLQEALGLEDGVLPAVKDQDYLRKDRCNILLSNSNRSIYQECLSIIESSLNGKRLEEEVLKAKTPEDCDQFPEGSMYHINCTFLTSDSDTPPSNEELAQP